MERGKHHLLVRPSSLAGSVTLPPSKSQTLRAILFGAMGLGESTIYRPLESPDARAMARACEALGATLRWEGESLTVEGRGELAQEASIDAGNSGIVYRFITAIAALGKGPVRMDGDASIRHSRPIRPLLEALIQLGAEVVYEEEEGRAPFTVRGPIQPGQARLRGEDSQPVSALLIAASFLKGVTTIAVDHPGEQPWIEMTLHWLRRMGATVTHRDYSLYRVEGGLEVAPFTYTVPGDFSAAAFPAAAAFTTRSQLSLGPLDWSEPQGDKRFFEVLRQMGGEWSYNADSQQVRVNGASPLKGLPIDVNTMIDAVPILGVLSCFAQGETWVTGGAIARQKECDRIAAITGELNKMGGALRATPDGFHASHVALHESTVSSYNDHRMAMALAVAALGAQGETTITDTACIQKSFPHFVSAMHALGADIGSYPELPELTSNKGNSPPGSGSMVIF